MICERAVGWSEPHDDGDGEHGVEEVSRLVGGLPHLVQLRVVLDSLGSVVGRSFDSESFLDLSGMGGGSSWAGGDDGRGGRRCRGRVVDPPVLAQGERRCRGGGYPREGPDRWE